ncbi:hypothetical protein KPL40_19135 [Clostridium gasigenes]|uniref:hypothetical protein n=1 Tax=Clostridium gasigenes TaxID=94869 RepID=UPI001C0D08A1|nr:hypothetical protein [Clostridium gasigenes]MBU3134531.1 hypothetical protein [Clostridium gasigenes]
MKAIVRDDIITLSSFVDAEFKYKYYLELLQKVGNYCLLDQFKTLVDGGPHIIKSMQESNLISTEYLNTTYKYIYLTDAAMKYLELRDSEKDFSEMKKNMISVTKIKKNPSQKQLFSSAFKFHLLINGDNIDKASILNEFEDCLYKQSFKKSKEYINKHFENDNIQIETLNKNIDKEVDKVNIKINFYNNMINSSEINFTNEDYNKRNELKSSKNKLTKELEQAKSKFVKVGVKDLEYKIQIVDNEMKYLDIKEKNFEDINKVLNNETEKMKNNIKKFKEEINKRIKNRNIAKKHIEEILNVRYENVKKAISNLYDISKVIARIKGDTLEFIIMDTGSFKTAYGYLKQINSLKKLELPFKNIDIIIYSYADHRALNLYNEFERVKKEKEKSLKSMQEYNLKTKYSSTKSDFYIAAEKIVENTPDFNVEIKEDLYYMYKYISIISKLDKSIKFKDKKVIDDLALRLKINSENIKTE